MVGSVKSKIRARLSKEYRERAKRGEDYYVPDIKDEYTHTFGHISDFAGKKGRWSPDARFLPDPTDKRGGGLMYPNNIHVSDVATLAKSAMPGLLGQMRRDFKASVKAMGTAVVAFYHPRDDDFQALRIPWATNDYTYLRVNTVKQIPEFGNKALKHLMDQLADTTKAGLKNSGWQIAGLLSLSIVTYNVTDMTGGMAIPTPPLLAAKTGAVVNILNTGPADADVDTRCGFYAMMAARYYEILKAAQNHNKCTPEVQRQKDVVKALLCGCLKGRELDPHTHDCLDRQLRKVDPENSIIDGKAHYDWTGVNFPMGEGDWDMFEAHNPGYLVDIRWYREEVGKPRNGVWRIGGDTNTFMKDRYGDATVPALKTVVRLVMFGDRNDDDDEDDEESDKNHFVWMRDVAAFLGVKACKQKVVSCPICLLTQQDRKRTWLDGLTSMEKHLKTHVDHNCMCPMVLPEEGSRDATLGFFQKPFSNRLNAKKQLRIPYVAHCDLESCMEELRYHGALSVRDGKTLAEGIEDARNGVRTIEMHRHVPVSAIILIVGPDGLVCHKQIIKDADPLNLVGRFFDRLHELQAHFSILLEEAEKPINMRTNADGKDVKDVPKSHWHEKTCSLCLNRVHDGFHVMTPREQEVCDDYYAFKAARMEEKNGKGGAGAKKAYFNTLPEDLREEAEAALAMMKWRKDADHDHLTGEYRGAAHPHCNRQYTTKKQPMPVFFHNGKGYDFHLLLPAIMPRTPKDSIHCIPFSSEQYRSIRWGDIELKDTMQFQPLSLGAWVDDTPIAQMTNTRAWLEQRVPWAVDHAMDLLRKKGAFPYQSLTSLAYLDTTEKPTEAAFASVLTTIINEDCQTSEEDIGADVHEMYLHFLDVWQTFDCKTMHDYHDVYLTGDGMQQADCFEAYRNASLDETAAPLDPAWYYGAPSLFWDKMLLRRENDLFSGAAHGQIGLITDRTQLDMLMRNMRGGYVGVGQRLAYANNPMMGELYDPTKPLSTIIYIDAVNLYGWAMKQYLPLGNYRWLKGTALSSFLKRLPSLPDDGDTGYVVEVSKIWCPESKHDYLNAYPGICEFKAGESSPAMHEYEATYAAKGTKKLIMDLKPKHNIAFHFRYLKKLMEIGWEVEGITSVLAFDQQRWMDPFISFNTAKRQDPSASKAQQNLAKLGIVAPFGKTVENKLKRTNFKIVNSKRQYEKMVRQPGFQYDVPFDKNRDFYSNVVGMHMAKEAANMDTPFCVGVCTTDLGKLRMLQIHYDVIKPKYGDAAKHVYTDTDSMIYQLGGDHDFYADLKDPEFADHFDLSGFHESSGLKNDIYRKQPGKFAVENPHFIITAVAAVKPKMYAMILLHNPSLSTVQDVIAGTTPDKKLTSKMSAKDVAKQLFELKAAKGCTKTVQQHQMFFAEYEACILKGDPVRKNCMRFASHTHDVKTVMECQRLIMNPYEDKRYHQFDERPRLPRQDSLPTFAHGHFKAT